jgi:hypothetical protein
VFGTLARQTARNSLAPLGLPPAGARGRH